MFEAISSISITTVVLVVFLWYVFRKNVKQIQEQLPELANNLASPVLKGAKQLDLIVTANCNENTVDLVKRTHAVIEELEGMKLDSIADAEKYILGLN